MQGLKALLLTPPPGRGQDGVTAIAAMVDSLETVLKDTRQHLAVSAGRDPWAIDIVSFTNSAWRGLRGWADHFLGSQEPGHFEFKHFDKGN